MQKLPWLGFLVFALSAGSARASSLRLAASFEWSRGDRGSGVGVALKLELPLERFATPLRRGPSSFGVAEDVAPAAPSAPPPAPPERAARKLADSWLARGAVAAARRVSERNTRRDRLDGLSTRARASATLPELVLRAARSTDQSLRLSPAETDVTVYDYTRTGGADLLLEARATWTLDRLVFASEELGIERLRIEHGRSDERLVDRVVALVFSWESARLRAQSEALEPEARLKAELEEIAALATLDVLTGGWFSEELDRRARRPR